MAGPLRPAFEGWRLPKGEAPRKVLGEVTGTHGHRILAAAYGLSAPTWLRELPAVQILRRAWVGQFHVEADRVAWRDRADRPPASLGFDGPYDPDARFGNERRTTWGGCKADLTETCDEERPHLAVHVETTPAPVSDAAVTAPVHEALRAIGSSPIRLRSSDRRSRSSAEHGKLHGPRASSAPWPPEPGS